MTEEEIRNSFTLKRSGYLLDLTIDQSFEDETTRLSQAKMITDNLLKILAENPGQIFSIIVDLNQVQTTYLNDEEKKVYLKLAENQQIQKAAIIGGNFFMKTVVNLIMEATGKGHNLRLFDGRQEALEWLNEDKPTNP